MFFSHGKSSYERGEHGDDFAVKNTLLQHVEVESDGNELITTLRLQTKKGITTPVSEY